MSDLIFQLLYFGRYYLGYYSYRFNLVSHIFVYKNISLTLKVLTYTYYPLLHIAMSVFFIKYFMVIVT